MCLNKINIQSNNYYGIIGFKDSPLKEHTKSVLSKLLFLYPRIENHHINEMPEIHKTEDSAWLYIDLLKKGMTKYDKEYISHSILLNQTYWINKVGFITMTELLEVRDYCGLQAIEYLENLCDEITKINFDNNNKCLTFLTNYSKFIEEKHIDYVLDQYCQTQVVKCQY